MVAMPAEAEATAGPAAGAPGGSAGTLEKAAGHDGPADEATRLAAGLLAACAEARELLAALQASPARREHWKGRTLLLPVPAPAAVDVGAHVPAAGVLMVERLADGGSDRSRQWWTGTAADRLRGGGGSDAGGGGGTWRGAEHGDRAPWRAPDADNGGSNGNSWRAEPAAGLVRSDVWPRTLRRGVAQSRVYRPGGARSAMSREDPSESAGERAGAAASGDDNDHSGGDGAHGSYREGGVEWQPLEESREEELADDDRSDVSTGPSQPDRPERWPKNRGDRADNAAMRQTQPVGLRQGASVPKVQRQGSRSRLQQSGAAGRLSEAATQESGDYDSEPPGWRAERQPVRPDESDSELDEDDGRAPAYADRRQRPSAAAAARRREQRLDSNGSRAQLRQQLPPAGQQIPEEQRRPAEPDPWNKRQQVAMTTASRRRSPGAAPLKVPGDRDAASERPLTAGSSQLALVQRQQGGSGSSGALEALLEEGGVLLREGREGLVGKVEAGVAERLLSQAAERFAAAVELDSASVAAVGQLGNALLAHGELKLHLARQLREMVPESEPPERSKGGSRPSAADEERRSLMERRRQSLLQQAYQAGDECEQLLMDAGRKYRAALSLDNRDARALHNWGLALCYRGHLLAEEAEDVRELMLFPLPGACWLFVKLMSISSAESAGFTLAQDYVAVADKMYLAAIDKFEAMLSMSTKWRVSALQNWGLALRDRSRLRALGSRKREKLMEQARDCFQSALDLEPSNPQLRGGLAAAEIELEELAEYAREEAERQQQQEDLEQRPTKWL
eukprot:SM000124S25941  [mRNA]  locus=s124:260179:262899:- [translate_table: standard]